MSSTKGLKSKSAQADEQFQAALAIARSGETERAMRSLERALKLELRHRGIRNALGVLRLETGDAEGAVALLKPLARELADVAGVQINFGNALIALRRADEAIAPLKRATVLEPSSALVWYGYGRALQIAGRAAEAEPAYRNALQRDPSHIETRANLAAACNFQDRYDNGELQARTAIAMAPQHAGAHVNLSMSLLAQRRWAEGWSEYEWREATDLLGAQRRAWAMPRWNGEAVNGKTVLVHAEQGFGDTIQFARYLPALRERGARVVLQCSATLVELIRHAELADDVVVNTDALPAHDYQVPLTGLPHRLGLVTSDAVYVSDTPYLHALPSRVSPLPVRASGARLRVGFVWAGSPTMMNEMNRGCGLEALLPLLAMNDVEWVSLQCGPRAADLASLPPDVRVHDLSSRLKDFADTSAVMIELDVVISTCTAVAHLAGALGRECWTLLPKVGLDWRWAGDALLDEERRTRWYESVWGVRQSVPQDWSEPVQRLRARLEERLAEGAQERLADAKGESVASSYFGSTKGHPESGLLSNTTTMRRTD